MRITKVRNRARFRDRNGQVATALNLFLGLFIIGALAIFSFELSRILLAREQLKACVDIAALSGEATLLSSSRPFATAQSNAKLTALNMIKRNSILGVPLTTATQVSSPSMLSPASGKTMVHFEFFDPVTGVVGGANSNVLRVTGAYSYQLFGGAVYGIGNTVYTVAAATNSSLPALDIYVLMDISSSMDDQTPVTWVLRKWDPNGNGGVGAPTYSIPAVSPPAEGTISLYGCPTMMGHPVNALAPQHLDTSQDTHAVPCQKCFSEILDVLTPTSKTDTLRGVTENNAPGDAPVTKGGVTKSGLLTPAPPVNQPTAFQFRRKRFDNKDPLYDPSRLLATAEKSSLKVLTENRPDPQFWELSADANIPPANYPECTFTHLVVNLDGGTTFNRMSGLGYNFTNIGTLVEASVGNLEDSGAATAASLDLTALATTPQAGYKDAYRILAAAKIEPLYTMEQSVNQFLTKIRSTADPHFGFVAFSEAAGNAPGDTFSDYKVSWAYPQGGSTTYPRPGIHINPTAGVNNYSTITNVITVPAVVGNSSSLIAVEGGTNVADALRVSLNKLIPGTNGSLTRTGAARAVVLVTDGAPTCDLAGTAYPPPPANGPAEADARTQAARAKAAGIPVFIVALSQDPVLDPYLDAIYSDTAPSGIAKMSGNGAKYYKVSWTNPSTSKQELDKVFGNIARQLVSLVQ